MQSAQEAQVPPILRLPPAIRGRIYHEFHPILGPWHFPLRFEINWDWLLSLQPLLLSCRAISEEVSKVLYSTNIFEISYKNAGSLSPLRNLRDTSLSSLRELKVVLNQASCHHERCLSCCEVALGCRPNGAPFNLCQERHTGLHGAALRPLDDSAASLLDEWRLTTTYLWPRITPEHLSISLVCDFDPQDENAPAAASRTVAPLVDLSPLKACHIRLSRARHRGLEEIAKDTVLQALGIVGRGNAPTSSIPSVEGATSKLLSLPREIRFRILEYTDLITPWTEVRWSREHKGYLPTLLYCELSNCPAYLHDACRFRSCWNRIVFGSDEPRLRVGCFCRVHHAAFSFNCQCWVPPTALFLVCRTLYRDAQAVFFTGNRFVVHDFKSAPPDSTPETQDYPNDRFAISEFLRDVVPVDCLHLLRSLEVTFPPYSPTQWPQEGSLVLCDWMETVRFIKENMNLGGLTMRLTMFEPPYVEVSGARRHITPSDAREVLQAYDRILRPMAVLGEEGLKRFYGHIPLPEKYATWFRDRESNAEHYTVRIVKGNRQLKKWAEQLVMGDRYGEQPEDACYWNAFSLEPFECAWRRIFIDTY